MKRLIFPFAVALVTMFATSFVPQQKPAWTAAELDAANTAKNVSYMDSLEKEVIKLCNLARMYPKKFSTIEVLPYYGGETSGSPAEISLKKELKAMNPRKALLPDSLMEVRASCFQKELEVSGEMGHKRKNCTNADMYGENCSFGEYSARGIVMQLLIDEGVPTYGHRRNILDVEFTRIGVAYGKHKTYSWCAVMDFR